MFYVTVCTFTLCDIMFRSIISHVCCLILTKYQYQCIAIQMSHVAWSVCVSVYLSVCWLHGCDLQKRLNRSRCRFEADCRRLREPLLDGGRDSTGKGNFGSYPTHCKAFGVSAATYNAAEKSLNPQ